MHTQVKESTESLEKDLTEGTSESKTEKTDNPSIRTPYVRELRPTLVKTNLAKELLSGLKKDPYEVLKKPIKESIVADLLFSDLEPTVLVTDRVCHTLRAGKIYRYRVTVATGNKKGVIGIGIGKHKFKDKAIVKAIEQSKKNLLHLRAETYNLELMAGKELDAEATKTYYYGPNKVTTAKLGSTVLEVAPLLSDSVTASKWGQKYCEIGGFRRIKITLKKKSSIASKMNYYKTLHEAIRLQNTLEDEQ